MKTVVIPTDFSPTSVNAAIYGAALASYIQAELLLLHVLPLPLKMSEVPLPTDDIELALEDANRSLTELKETLEHSDCNKLKISFRVTTESFLKEIDRFNQQKELFAVIMGASGAGAMEAFFLGSFTLTALRHLECPLIIVPPDYRYKAIETIGFACDLHNNSGKEPVKCIHSLMEHYKAHLELVFVAKPGERKLEDLILERKNQQCFLAAYRPEIRIVTNDDVRKGLEGFIEERRIDLLLLWPRERKFPERFFQKNITRQMVRHATIPTMVAHN